MFLLTGLSRPQPPYFEQALQRLPPTTVRRWPGITGARCSAPGYEVRYRLLMSDGRQRDVHALTEVRNGPTASRAVGVVIDDTEGADRVRAQQAVSAQLARALELAKVSVWRIDSRPGASTNAAGYAFGGRPPAPRACAGRVARWCIPMTCPPSCVRPNRRSPGRTWSTSRPATCMSTAAGATC